MRKFSLMLLIAGGILSIEGSPASAAPANGSAIASALKSNSLIQDVPKIRDGILSEGHGLG
jgi:hypothetical protein